MTGVSRSPVELARDPTLIISRRGAHVSRADFEAVARALLEAESAFEEIGRHPENAGKVAEFALSVLRGSE